MGFSKTNLPSSSGTGPLSPSASSETRVITRSSSDVTLTPSPEPDPRWPYLNRWSGSKTSLAESIGQIKSSVAKSPPSSSPPVIDPMETAAALHAPVDTPSFEDGDPSLKSKQSGFEAPPKEIAAVPMEIAAVPPSAGTVAPPPSSGIVAPPLSSGTVALLPRSTENVAPPQSPTGAVAEAMTSPPISTEVVALPMSSKGTVAPPVASPDEATALKTNPPKEMVNPLMRQEPLPQRSLGAWNKKLNLLPRCETQVFQKPVKEMEDPIRFPWAARMNQASRNLYRAIEPVYLEDGTPKVTIPSNVFLQGLENQKEYVLGQFFRCSLPPGGLVYAVLNNLWGRDCKITIRKLGDSSYLFHIPNESTRTWVLQRGLWHVDDCIMFVAPWSPGPSLAIPEIKTIPMWVTLKKIPNALYSILGISHIASGLGAPIKTHKPRLDPILMGEAKILVEVELNKAFPPRIAASDDSGFISMVDVEYAWLPSTCGRCGQLGHKVKRCLQAGSDSAVVVHTTTKAPVIDDTAGSDSAVVAHTTTKAPVIDDTVVCNEVSEPQVNSVRVNVIEGEPSSPVTTAPLAATIVTIPNLVIPTSTSEKVTMCTPQVISQAATTNEKVIESPISGTARPLSVTKDTIAQEHSSSHLGKERSIEPDFGSNQFASLFSLEEDADSSESDKELDETDHMTPSGKRILRDRPVKPTAKAKEMYWQSTARGRGNRGRGNRG